MSQHEQFEIMCAFAAVGQLDPSDLAGLRRHVEDCADCQRRLSEFAQVSAQALLLFGEKCSNKHRLPAGMTARFVARARAEGIPLQKSADSLPRELFHSLGWKGNIAAALLMFAIVAGISNRIHTPAFSTSPSAVGANATAKIPLEPKAARVRSSRLLEPKLAVRRAKDHRRFENAGPTVARVQSSELAFTTSLGLTPSSARYSANCDQGGVKPDSSLFSRAAEIKEPRLFKALATSHETGPVAPWLTSLNSLPPVFLYTTDRQFFLRSSQMGMSEPNIDWSKIRLGVLSESSRSKRLPQYQEVPEQRWPFLNEFKLDAR